LLDWNYARTAKAHNLPVQKKKGQALEGFPIEEARLNVLFRIMIPGIAAILCYGWPLHKHSTLAAPLILQFIIAFSFTCGMNTTGTLLVDLYPESPATVSAANNLGRCLFSAGATAVVNPMIEGMGLEWCFIFIGLLCFSFYPILQVILRKGPAWRAERYKRLRKT
jgi:predicted MFS family arabinose efflux permease